jgi:subtilase family serine protease
VTRSRLFVALATGATVAASAFGVSGAAGAGAPPQNPSVEHSHKPVCGPVPPGQARCHEEIVTDAQGNPLATTGPTSGYGPADIVAAYKLPALPAANSAFAWNGKTVAIVDAYDDPNAEADLGVYRSWYKLPACTTANGCFNKVNESGATSPLPAADAGWAQEISLDLDAVSAACPDCKILLVEANSSYMTDLGAGVNAAVAKGATAISNSYGGSEYSTETTDETNYFKHPGVAITASTGDSGYGVEFPAASRYVTAVGGTSLTRTSSGRMFTEAAWSGAGSGCSAVIPKPTWQKDTGCARRTVADVSAVANPSTGLAIYDSWAYQGYSGWFVVGGTSLASPLVASVYALAAIAPGAPVINDASYAYTHASSLFDVTSGTNGHCLRRSAYLCTAGFGYDGPTGLGTPNATAAF